MGNLKDKYCIVGIGETPYVRGAGRSTRSLGVEAVRNAIIDSGLDPAAVNGMMSYSANDSASSLDLAEDLGIHLKFYMDCSGGGSSTEALVGLAIGAIEAGMCETVALFRSMNGYSGTRFGGTPSGGRPAASVLTESALDSLTYGLQSPAQRFSLAFRRHMHDYGTTSEQAARVKVVHSRHASNNPKAIMKKRVTVDDVMNSRWIVKPTCHLLDCCLETDNATSMIITTAERARDLKQKPIYIMAVTGRTESPFPNLGYQCDPISRSSGYYARQRVFGNAGVEPKDISITGCYDAFTFTPIFLFEAFGFCGPGEGGHYFESDVVELGGKRPTNTSGGHLCEGYTHGMSMVIENVRQLRHQADDSCPDWREGKHTYDYSEGGCRQQKDVELSMNMGWGMPTMASSLILRR